MEIIYIKNKAHYIFDSQKEYETFFQDRDGVVPPLKHNWREAAVGDWVLADDGGVCQILYSGKSKGVKWDRYVRTAIGTYACYHRYKMDTDKSLHAGRYRFGTIGKGKSFLTKKEREFILYLISGHSLKNAYETVYGEHVDWHNKAMEIIRRPLVMSEIRKSVSEIAESLGLTLEYIFKKYKELAEESRSEAVKLGAIKELSEILGVKSQGQLGAGSPDGSFGGFSQKEIKGVEKEIEDADVLEE